MCSGSIFFDDWRDIDVDDQSAPGYVIGVDRKNKTGEGIYDVHIEYRKVPLLEAEIPGDASDPRDL